MSRWSKPISASIQAAEASVETARLNLGFTQVRSLVNGIAGIAPRRSEIWCHRALFSRRCRRSNPIKVYFSISEQEYLALADRIKPRYNVDLLRQKSGVPLQLDSGKRKHVPTAWTCLIRGPSGGHADRQHPLVGAFPNPGNILRPGQFGRIRALTAINENALLIPQRAVSQLQGRYQVAVVGRTNTINIREVKVGDQIGDQWVILSGLKANEK